MGIAFSSSVSIATAVIFCRLLSFRVVASWIVPSELVRFNGCGSEEVLTNDWLAAYTSIMAFIGLSISDDSVTL
jgi:hypothetical protein